MVVRGGIEPSTHGFSVVSCNVKKFKFNLLFIIYLANSIAEQKYNNSEISNIKKQNYSVESFIYIAVNVMSEFGE